MEIDEKKLLELNNHASSLAFTPLEKLVLAYTDHVTRTPADVPDSVFERLRDQLSERQIVELTATIAWENFVTRFNRGLDVQPEGFSEGAFCLVPDRGSSTSDADSR